MGVLKDFVSLIGSFLKLIFKGIKSMCKFLSKVFLKCFDTFATLRYNEKIMKKYHGSSTRYYKEL